MFWGMGAAHFGTDTVRWSIWHILLGTFCPISPKNVLFLRVSKGDSEVGYVGLYQIYQKMFLVIFSMKGHNIRSWDTFGSIKDWVYRPHNGHLYRGGKGLNGNFWEFWPIWSFLSLLGNDMSRPNLSYHRQVSNTIAKRKDRWSVFALKVWG